MLGPAPARAASCEVLAVIALGLRRLGVAEPWLYGSYRFARLPDWVVGSS